MAVRTDFAMGSFGNLARSLSSKVRVGESSETSVCNRVESNSQRDSIGVSVVDEGAIDDDREQRRASAAVSDSCSRESFRFSGSIKTWWQGPILFRRLRPVGNEPTFATGHLA